MLLLRRANVVRHCATASLASSSFGEKRVTRRELRRLAVDSVQAFFASPDVDLPDWELNIGLEQRGPSF